MEDALTRVCEFFYEELRARDGARACPLVRAYKTHPYGALEPPLQSFAAGLMGNATPKPDMKCLTLMATVGDRPEWNHRLRSRGHQAIPLPRPDIVEKAPMIAQLLRQFGLEPRDVIEGSETVVQKLEGRTYGVFHVESARGSPYIPAQDEFVERYDIESVIGCGGALRGGDLFALILFSRVRVPSEVADRFRTLALDIKSSLFHFDESRVFSAQGA